MKAKFLLFAVLLNGALFACNDHLFKLALNQRSFYNPAALCPYCKGSIFFSTGLSFIPGANNGMGMYYAFGNDGPNSIAGPWDFSYSAIRTTANHIDAYSFRYAYSVQADKWKIAAGFRESYYAIRENVLMSDATTQKYSTRMFDTDIGVMATNQKGIYVGISLLHISSPAKNSTNEFGLSHTIEMPANLNIMGGYVQRINKKWDALPDISMMHNKTESVAEMGGMIRYKHHFAAGGGVTFATNEPVDFEIRGGYMSSSFKWLVSAAPTADGWTIETGIVLRLLSGPCDGTSRGHGGGGTCSAGPEPKSHPRKGPVKDNDDFVRHR